MDSTVSERNREAVREAFTAYATGDRGPFLAMVDPGVRWTVIGSTPISGTYESLAEFNERASGVLRSRLAGPLVGRVRNVLADGDWVVLQWESSAPGVNGVAYEQTYCWVMRLADGRIVETTAYLDTEVVSAVLA